MNKPTEKQIEDVLAGVATAETARLVAQWFATDEGNNYLSSALSQDISQIKSGYEEIYVDHDIPTQKILAEISQRIRRKRMRRIMFRVAAVLLPFLLLVGLYVNLESRVDLLSDSGYEEIYVPKGARVQMAFQDGTRVHINSDSRLKYPKKFGLSKREIFLEGEAYFIVSPDKRWPFIVNLDGSSIHVLGTSFDVQAYPENKEITVYLDEGKINLTLPSSKAYPLLPGEKLVYDRDSNLCTITNNANSPLSSVWKNDVIAFKDTPLAEVIKVLGRWYDVDFKIEDQAPMDIRFTLTSEKPLLEKVLQELEKIAPLQFTYKEQEKTVIVTSKK